MTDPALHPPPRLLLVDDDRALASMLREYLELQGFAVRPVESGEQALELIARETPDLVVLDVGLPGIDGFETLERLRRERSVPVIMLTARGEERDRIAGLLAGADDYLPKPFNPLELAARIRAVLKRSTTSGTNMIGWVRTTAIKRALSGTSASDGCSETVMSPSAIEIQNAHQVTAPGPPRRRKSNESLLTGGRGLLRRQ